MVGSEVSDLKNALNNSNLPYIMRSAYRTGFINSSNVWSTNANRYHMLIPVSGGQSFSITGGNSLFSYAFLQDNVFAAGVAPNFCASTSKVVLGTGSDSGTIPADCHYLYVYCSNGTDDLGPTSLVIDGYDWTSTVKENILNVAESFFDKTIRQGKIYTSNASFIADVPSGNLGDFEVNKVFCIGSSSVNPLDEPIQNFTGTIVTLSYTNVLMPGNVQVAISSKGDLLYRYYKYVSGGNVWEEWQTAATPDDISNAVDALDTTLSESINQVTSDMEDGLSKTVQTGKIYTTSADFVADVPSSTLGDLPVNRIFTIGSSAVNAVDEPVTNFSGIVTTLSYREILMPGDIQFAISSKDRVFYRYYQLSSGVKSWRNWHTITIEPEEYHVGIGQEYTSFAALLYALKGNENKKTIYIHEGEYNIFAEYMSLVSEDKITIPPDTIGNASYFEPYNVFVPNNTRIVGLGNVVLKMMPEADEITYGASRTWSPLNIYGSVEIENITVLGHNCRYCLHNDDHNAYPGAVQIYRNCKFVYTHSDTNASDQLLGFNTTIGFGIQKDGTHIFDGCEIVIDSTENQSAYYGHESSGAVNGSLILRNCIIRSTNFDNNRTLRFQSLSGEQGHVCVSVENCYINGGIRMHMYHVNDPQNFDVTLTNCNRVPVTWYIPSGGTVVDPYGVRWVNPLPTPTSESPLISSDVYGQ